MIRNGLPGHSCFQSRMQKNQSEELSAFIALRSHSERSARIMLKYVLFGFGNVQRRSCRL